VALFIQPTIFHTTHIHATMAFFKTIYFQNKILSMATESYIGIVDYLR
jgi:hypothetical protein